MAENTNTKNEGIDDLISVWSMRPHPDSSEGVAWARGARWGWEQAQRILKVGTGDTPAQEMRRRLEAERKDAERYRWLKANHLQTGPDSWIRTGDDLEEAIDAAMRETPNEG